MAKIVNLGQVRKDRDRAEKRQIADENAVKFGRTKGEKQQDSKAAVQNQDHVDGHKRDPDG